MPTYTKDLGSGVTLTIELIKDDVENPDGQGVNAKLTASVDVEEIPAALRTRTTFFTETFGAKWGAKVQGQASRVAVSYTNGSNRKEAMERAAAYAGQEVTSLANAIANKDSAPDLTALSSVMDP